MFVLYLALLVRSGFFMVDMAFSHDSL